MDTSTSTHSIMRCNATVLRVAVACFLFASSASASALGSPRCNNSSVPAPLKVFLLDGQSNMVGMGSLEHLKILLDDEKTHKEYVHLWNTTSNNDWAERADVYIKFDDQVGKLKAGLGAAGPSHGGHIGPELEFGLLLGDQLQVPSSLPHCPNCETTKPKILLLKAAYGGRNLAIDLDHLYRESETIRESSPCIMDGSIEK